MKKTLALLFLAAGVMFVLFISCGESSSAGNGGSGGRLGDMKSGGITPGDQKFEKLLDHYDNMIKILKDNKGNKEKALKDESSYVEKYEDEIKMLTEEIAKNPMGFVNYAEAYKEKLEEYTKLKTEILMQQ